MSPLAVFDVDGTLVDSRETIHRAAIAGARAAGLPDPDYDAVRQVIGITLRPALARLMPEPDEARLDAYVSGYQAAFRAMADAPGFKEPLYPGAEELLHRLARDGWRLSMATGKSRAGVDRVLRAHGWGELFASTHCSDDGPGKPDPHMLRCAVEAAGATPARTAMIGDTSHDMAMALALGARAQGVGWGFHTAEEVAASGAHHVALTMGELEAELNRWAASGFPERGDSAA